MDTDQLYHRLARAASLEGEEAALRFRTNYAPAGGPASKVYPPTYPHPKGQRGQSTYLLEKRYVLGEPIETVLLDATQSQANRCEQALMSAGTPIPHLALTFEVDARRYSLTSLDAPHRSRDAYFRDAVLADTSEPFDTSEVGKALATATEREPLAYYRHSPADLVYGSWDSHRGKRRATRFARVYTSEVFGLRPEMGRRGAGRMDPFVLPGKDTVRVGSPASAGKNKPEGDPAWWTQDDKGNKELTDIGHGMIPPSLVYRNSELPQPGGVVVAGIERHAVIGFAGLARHALVSADETPGPDAQRAGRAVLAALAILGDRLAFSAPGVFLRSGCELLREHEELAWVSPGGEEQVEIGRDQAIELFNIAVATARDAGLGWDAQALRMVPAPNMQSVLEKALTAIDLDPAK